MPGWQRVPTKIIVAVDESCTTATAGAALRWAASNLCDPSCSVSVCIVTVLPPPALPSYPFTPALAGISQPYKAPQRARDDAQATACLREAAQLMVDMGARRECIEGVVLDGVGGASGVAESIIQFAQKRRVDAVVLGARGMGAIKRSLVHIVGLGSVSDYCIHNLHLPVVVVRAEADVHPRDNQASRTMCLAFDNSPQATFALTWALQHVLTEGDMLHIVTVAVAVPFPFVGEEPVLVAELEEQQWQEAKTCALADAQELADKAAQMAVQMGWDGERLVAMALQQKPGANEVAMSIAMYANAHKADLLVVGARGLGSFKRSVMSLVGLGSVSDYLVHNVTSCPVAVVKVQEQHDEEPPSVPGHRV